MGLAFPQSNHDATIITFDAPGAVNGTSPSSINPAGVITGSYTDAHFLPHGFLRASDGAMTTIDAPGATFTNANGINPAGVVTGSYVDTNRVSHGFMRVPTAQSPRSMHRVLGRRLSRAHQR